MTFPGGDPDEKAGRNAEPADTQPRQDFPSLPGSPGFEAPPGYPPPPGYPGPMLYPPPPPEYGTPGYCQPFPIDYGPPKLAETNTLAIASLIASVVGLFCGIGAIVGIVLGAIALNQIKQTRQQGHGLAVAGIVIGVASLLVSLIVVVYALR